MDLFIQGWPEIKLKALTNIYQKKIFTGQFSYLVAVDSQMYLASTVDVIDAMNLEKKWFLFR